MDRLKLKPRDARGHAHISTDLVSPGYIVHYTSPITAIEHVFTLDYYRHTALGALESIDWLRDWLGAADVRVERV